MRISPLGPRRGSRLNGGMDNITTSYYDGEAIRVVRCLRGWSRRALAERAGLRDGRLQSIELGATPRPDELAKIWGALTCEPPRTAGGGG